MIYTAEVQQEWLETLKNINEQNSVLENTSWTRGSAHCPPDSPRAWWDM